MNSNGPIFAEPRPLVRPRYAMNTCHGLTQTLISLSLFWLKERVQANISAVNGHVNSYIAPSQSEFSRQFAELSYTIYLVTMSNININLRHCVITICNVTFRCLVR